ncbi:MAG: histone deacetylase [Planctomycetota bacterium]
MTLLYYDPRFLLHETGEHPEKPERLRSVHKALDTAGLAQRCQKPVWEPASPERIASVHTASHLGTLERIAADGGGMADTDTVVSPASVDVARLAAGAAADAARRVVAGEDANALCLVRPPGHHALAHRAMGFCLLANVAIAARAALDEGLERVLIVDWDVHHGNGTQALFYDDPRVGFFSVHRWPFYPGTGAGDETGRGDGLGTTLNVPLTFGTPRQQYRGRFAAGLERMVERMRPELILVSAGFDAHRLDPIGSLGLEVGDFQWLTNTVNDAAESCCAGRVVSLLEGGYCPVALSECVVTHLRGLLGVEDSSAG